jgi:ethanolamine utilization protein EutA
MSLCHPEKYFLNIDIGGGTSNLALGINGQVVATGSYFIGARHFLWKENRWIAASPFAAKLPGCESSDTSLEEAFRISRCYVDVLEKIVRNTPSSLTSFLTEAPYLNSYPVDPVIVFSGGVGSLVYEKKFPDFLAFGDLGPSLARCIRKSAFFSRSLGDFVPAQTTRATAVGLGAHNTRISGSSIYICNDHELPLTHVPIMARVSFDSEAAVIEKAISCTVGFPVAAVQITGTPQDYRALREFAGFFASASSRLVLLVEENLGKVLGTAITVHARPGVSFFVLDEIECAQAQFVSIGKPLDSSVPLSFFGFY